MDYLLEMKKQQIHFELIDEKNAVRIMEHEYSYFQLMEYANLFERYNKTEKKDLFVNLDFAQLYALAEIDKQLRHLIMTQSLEIENTLKLQILAYFNKNSELSDSILHRYIMSDKEFLMNTYNDARLDILKGKYKDVSFENLRVEQFLDVIQFGTLERLYVFLYENHDECDLNHLEMIKECLSSIRRLRNAAAHNNSILSNINIKIEDEHNCFSSKYLYQFLKKRGCGKKTLETNFTKRIIRDLCNLEWLLKLVDSPKKQYKWYNEWYHFWENISIEYGQLLFGNERLKSTCTFMQSVNRLLLQEMIEIKVDYGKN